ncbi:MAG: TIR domain-containing protein [Caulobacterales bacterium]|jgi:hypothetical protein
MTSEPFVYWKPGDEERQIRVFISHRYDRDKQVYDDVLHALRAERHVVQDISLTAADKLTGPRGGPRPDLEIQAEIAARIYTSDLLIASSRPGTGTSEWLSWEVGLAAIGYGVPVLFVKEHDMTYQTKLVREIAGMGLPHRVAERRTDDIVRKAVELIDGRPDWGVRFEEEGPKVRFRGPTQTARDSVREKLPFTPRLPRLASTHDQKSSIWNRLTGKSKSSEDGSQPLG